MSSGTGGLVPAPPRPAVDDIVEIECGAVSVRLTEAALGRFVTKAREKQELTTTELAKRVGVSQAQISRLENGKQGFRSSTLRHIAAGLGLEARVVFS